MKVQTNLSESYVLAGQPSVFCDLKLNRINIYEYTQADDFTLKCVHIILPINANELRP